MGRKNVLEVFRCFAIGKSKRGNTVSTDGETLYSYALPLASRVFGSLIAVVPWSAAPSMTTKQHLSSLRAAIRINGMTSVEIPETDVEILSRGDAYSRRSIVRAHLEAIAKLGTEHEVAALALLGEKYA